MEAKEEVISVELPAPPAWKKMMGRAFDKIKVKHHFCDYEV